MAQHTLPHGKRLISALSDFGELLGYYVEREFPVDVVTHGEPPAVDVAWFAEKGQKYPLMIFEVESAAGNTIPNNPLKVFGQLTSAFEKPLFYFQIVASGGSETPRISYLQNQYGTHNYRIYKIGEDEGTHLVYDILNQHRRINNRVNYVGLFHLLAKSEWHGVVDTLAVLRHAYAIGLSPSERLPAYVHLARSHPEVLEDLRSAITGVEVQGWVDVGEFKSYLGQFWAPFLLCSFMLGHSHHPLREKWDKALARWQNETTYMPLFVAALGQDRDYTEFLLGVSGPFVTLCAAASGELVPSIRELAIVLRDLLSQINPGWQGFMVAVWLAHLAAWAGDLDLFEAARSFINSAGGLSMVLLLKPPSSMSIYEGTREEEFPPGDEVLCPDLTSFRAVATEYYKDYSKPDARQLVLRALDDDPFFFDWAEEILSSLWAPHHSV